MGKTSVSTIKTSENAVKTISFMMIITLVGKFMGLFREQLSANAFGTGAVSAAFSVASTMPRTFMDVIFASAISASFIPIFNHVLEREGREKAYEFANNFITIVTLFSVVVTVFAMFAAVPISNFMLGAKFQAETILLSSRLFLIMMPLLVLSVVAFSLIGILQSLGEFNIPAAMSISSNGIIIAYYFVFMDKFGVFGLAYAFVLGWLTQILIQLPFLKKNSYHYRPILNFKDPNIKAVIALMLPVMVGSWVQPVNILVNTKIANGIDTQWGKSLDYANTLFLIIGGVFVLSVSNVIFTKLSKFTVFNDQKQFGETMNKTIRSLVFFLLPLTVGMIVLAMPLVRLVYEGGAFNEISTNLTSKALIFYSVGFLGYGVQTILSRGFYANKDGKTPMITGFVAIILNGVLSVVLIKHLGIGGPALASSVAINTIAILMIIIMRKKNKTIVDKRMLIHAVYMTVSAVLMGFIVNWFYIFLDNAFSQKLLGQLISICLCAIVGVIVYFVATLFFKVDEAKIVFEYIKKVLNKLYGHKL